MASAGPRNPQSPPVGIEPAARSVGAARWLVIYDGDCELCRRLAQFATRRDRRRRLDWLAAGSEAGRRALVERGLLEAGARSLVLIEPDAVWLRSAAVLRICRQLGWPWKLLYVLVWIPGPWRDALYDWVAQRRGAAACSR